MVSGSLEDKMRTAHFRPDATPHIVVDGTVCGECAVKACVWVCPANLFVPLADGTILFNYEQCFECGACAIACNREGAISWSYPGGGFGVTFRES